MRRPGRRVEDPAHNFRRGRPKSTNPRCAGGSIYTDRGSHQPRRPTSKPSTLAYITKDSEREGDLHRLTGEGGRSGSSRRSQAGRPESRDTSCLRCAVRRLGGKMEGDGGWSGGAS
ncbi:hypothetical protein ABZP36_000986, partial [Zizania latifolia]